jgi:hypothetical protein
MIFFLFGNSKKETAKQSTLFVFCFVFMERKLVQQYKDYKGLA